MNIRVQGGETVLSLTVNERRLLINARSLMFQLNKHGETELSQAAGMAHKDIEAVLLALDFGQPAEATNGETERV